ncbi:hypothetical protein [Pyruvatibacter sp.]
MTPKATAFLAKNPTFIGAVAGYRFYEHPTLGDESPLVYIKDGRVGLSDFWEVPTLDELYDLYDIPKAQ